jgi:16S rRNA (cytosine967-C5)-methyltransferase
MDIQGVRNILTYPEENFIEYWPHLQAEKIRAKSQSKDAQRSIRESIPEWLDEFGASALGDGWDAELHALNEPAKMCLRVNTLLTTRSKVQAQLLREGTTCLAPDDLPAALVPEGKLHLQNHVLLNDGYVEIQDVSSQLVAAAMELTPGLKVLDVCAGAGGKSLHIAALMENRGSILSCDVSEGKLKELERRAKRARVRCITTTLLTEQFAEKHRAGFDRVLLDVPCSSLGVMRRKPDLKWKLSPAKLDEITGLQKSILFRYASCVKPGGLLIYSTCSILPRENEEQVAAFLAEFPAFSLQQEHKISAAASGYDGFYIAVMKRS